jgi:hypothetical protein
VHASHGLDEVQPERRGRDPRRLALPADGVVVGDGALLLDPTLRDHPDLPGSRAGEIGCYEDRTDLVSATAGMTLVDPERRMA